MADTSNLSNYLKDIANAIRTKKETTEEILASEFDNEILSIETGGSGDVKLFETEDEMQADETAKEGDLAVVYRSGIQNATVDSQFSSATFPKTVVLPEVITDHVDVRCRAVDTSVSFMSYGQLDSSMFAMECYTESGSITIDYMSEDGITYTRIDDEEETIDFGTEIYFYRTDYWNDAVGYFIQIGGMTFEGLYEYTTKPDGDKSAWLTNMRAVDGNGVYDLDKANGLSVSGMTQVCNEILSHFNVDRTRTHYVSFVQSGDTLCAYVGLTVSSGITYITNLSLVQDTSNNWGMGTYSTELTDGVYKVTLGDTLTYTKLSSGTKIPVGTYTWGHWKYGSVATTDKYTVLKVSSTTVEPTSEIAVYGYNVGYDYSRYNYGETTKFYHAPTQLTVDNANELLPGVLGYGSKGLITGDGSIYDVLDTDKTVSAAINGDTNNLKTTMVAYQYEPNNMLTRYVSVTHNEPYDLILQTSDGEASQQYNSSTTTYKGYGTGSDIRYPNYNTTTNIASSSSGNNTSSDDIVFYGLVDNKPYMCLLKNSKTFQSCMGFIHNEEIYLCTSTSTSSTGVTKTIYKVTNNTLSSALYTISGKSNYYTTMITYWNGYLYYRISGSSTSYTSGYIGRLNMDTGANETLLTIKQCYGCGAILYDGGLEIYNDPYSSSSGQMQWIRIEQDNSYITKTYTIPSTYFKNICAIFNYNGEKYMASIYNKALYKVDDENNILTTVHTYNNVSDNVWHQPDINGPIYVNYGIIAVKPEMFMGETIDLYKCKMPDMLFNSETSMACLSYASNKVKYILYQTRLLKKVEDNEDADTILMPPNEDAEEIDDIKCGYKTSVVCEPVNTMLPAEYEEINEIAEDVLGGVK